MRVELAERLAQGAVCGGDGGLAALRRLSRSRQDRAVEGEILGRHRLGQDAGIMLDQVEPEIVLPPVDVLTADQGEVPVTAEGCQTMNSGCPAIPAAVK